MPATDSAARLTGLFQNNARYTSSKGEFIGPGALDLEVFQCFSAQRHPAKGAEIARTAGHVSANFIEDGKITASCDRTEASGVKATANGFELTRDNCGGGMGVGCGRSVYEVFVDSGDNLVVVESARAVGWFLIPFALYSKLYSVYPRIDCNDPSNADVCIGASAKKEPPQ